MVLLRENDGKDGGRTSTNSSALRKEPIVDAEVKRLESLIGKLEDTNEELRLEGDCELMEGVRENEGVVGKYRRMSEMMERDVGLAPGVGRMWKRPVDTMNYYRRNSKLFTNGYSTVQNGYGLCY